MDRAEIEMGFPVKRVEYEVTVPPHRASLAESGVPTLPSFDVELFEISLVDFETRPKSKFSGKKGKEPRQNVN